MSNIKKTKQEDWRETEEKKKLSLEKKCFF